jgi:protein-tyrosine phosphatase
MNYSEILDGKIYQGTAPDKWSDLDPIKPDIVVSLSDEDTIAPKGQGTYIYYPIEDGPLPVDVERLINLANFLSQEVSAHGKVCYYHCAVGINRSSLLTGLVLYFLGVASGQALVDYIRTKRPGALSNRTFADFLRAFPAGYMLKLKLTAEERGMFDLT